MTHEGLVEFPAFAVGACPVKIVSASTLVGKADVGTFRP
jgi:hypothetical protein